MSLTQAAYERLRGDVLTCRLRPGEKLVIGDLCRELGFSLGAVREALSRLTSEGLVIAEPQRGFRVAPISEDELLDLTQVRIQIECLCLEQSIAKGDVAWEARLVAAYHALSRIPEREPKDQDRLSETWINAHNEYHAALVGGCASPWLLRLRAILYAQSERYRRLSLPLARQARPVGDEHRDIMQATLARDFPRASELLRQHLSTTASILLRANAVGEMHNAPTRDVSTPSGARARRTPARA